MLDARELISRGLTVSIAIVLSACAPMAVKDIAANKTGYLEENFTPAKLPPDITKKLGSIPSSSSAQFKRMKLRYTVSIEGSDGKKETSTVATTYTNAGNGLIQEMREYSNNDIPFGLQYELSYGGLMPLRFQTVRLRQQTANLMIEAKQINTLNPGVLNPKEDTEYVLNWLTGSSVQFANFTDTKLICRSGKFYSAAKLNPKFSGNAISLDCERHNNGVLSRKQKVALLQQYGVTVRLEGSSSSDKEVFTIAAVEEIL